MKIIILSMLLVGCATTTTTTTTSSSNDLQALHKKVADLEESVDYQAYEQTNRYCFNFKDVCFLQAHNHCEGKVSKQTCNKQAQDACFKKHEECIVSNYHRWQDLKKLKNYK